MEIWYSNKETGFHTFFGKIPKFEKICRKTLITTDGTSLLGADDKAGVAEIVTAADIFWHIQNIKHGKNCHWFYTRRRNRKRSHKFNVAKFGAEDAYTMDGSEVGELELQNFNAAGAVVKINGN